MKNTYLTKNSNVKGFKFVRRILAVGMAVGMLVTALPSVSAAQYTAPDTVVDYFSTFHGYEQTGGSLDAGYFKDAKLPQGWSEASWSPNKAWMISGYSDTETGSNIIKTKDSNIIYKLDEPVKSGKLHVSFDLKTESNAATVNIGGYNTSVNDNPNDCWSATGNFYTYSYFLKTKVEDNKGYIYMPSAASNVNGALESSVKENDGKWHKYDVFINFDVTNDDNSYGKMSVYQDGISLGEVPMTAPYAKTENGLKSIFIQTGWGTNDRGYFDNFYIHNIKSDDNFEAPRIALDYANSGVLSNGGTIDVVFSETVDAEEFMPIQFDVKNVATGKKVDVVSVSNISGTSGARISLPPLETGEYEVSVKPLIKGAISEKAVENTAKFMIAGATIGDSTRYYINENFNTYKGGMPADFEKLSTVTASELTADAVESGNNALTLGGSDDKALSYEFNNSIYSGKFTVEFDVKHSGAGWTLGLMDKSDYFSDSEYITLADYNQEMNNVTYSYWNTEKTAGNITDDWGTWANAKTLDPTGTLTNKEYYFNQWTKEQHDSEGTENPQRMWLYKRIGAFNNRRVKNTLVGNMMSGDTDRTKLSTAKVRSNEGDTALDGVTVPANEWTKVKAVVDLDAGKYYFYVNDSTDPVAVEYKTATDGNYDTARFARTYLRDTDGNYKILGGIAGLRLQKYGDGTVEFDNVKVYTDKSYNDYLDFNTASTNGSTQPGWYSNNATTWSNMQYFGHNGENYRLSTNGANSAADPSDKAIKFNRGWTYYTHPFAVPVKAAQAFTVEFDLFAEDNTRWVMNLLDERYMTRNVDNTATTGTVFNGEKGTAGTQEKHTMEQNGILTNVYGSTSTVGFATVAGTSFTPQYAQNFKEANITYNTNKWQHIKLEFVPASNEEMTLVLSVTCDGETKTSGKQWLKYSWYESGKARMYKYDTIGLAFLIPGESGKGISVDNIKVTETETASKAAVTSITTADEKGEQIDLADKVYKVGDVISDINVEFSAPLNNSDAITLYYPQDENGAAPRYTVTMSGDKKSATVKLTECDMNKNVTLCISNKANMGSTNLTAPDTASATFGVVQAEDKLVIEDFRLYEHIDGRTFNNYSCEGIWVPVTADKLDGDKYKTFNGLKIVAKGYNTGSPKNVLMMSGIYNNTDAVKDLLSASEIENKEVPTGRFDNVEYTIESTDTDANLMKCFIWDANNLKPLWNKLEYGKTPATAGK
jgi:hypothetical protein